MEDITQESQDPQVPTQGGTEEGSGSGSHDVHRLEGTLGAQVITGGLWVCRLQGILETQENLLPFLPTLQVHAATSQQMPWREAWARAADFISFLLVF